MVRNILYYEYQICIDISIISKIFNETFKRSSFIHSDKAAVMVFNNELDYDAISTELVAGVGTQGNRDLRNQMDKWLEMLDMIVYLDEETETISRQILYLKVISLFCRDNDGNGLLRYQLQAGNTIFFSEQSIPLKFGYEHRVTEIPYVTFLKKGGANNALFLDKNPILDELFRADAGNDNQENTFTLEEISEHEITLMSYIDYICTVVELYAHLCLSRCK
jgi:hypothetical protein